MLNKIKNYNDKKNLLISFFLPIIILIFFCIINKISYHDFFIADLQEQYGFFFYYLKDVFDGNSSIFYSYYKQLGGSMLGTYIYYLSSPWNLLLFFIPKDYISIFIVCLIFVKIGLSSMTSYLYLKNHFKTKYNMLLLFSLTYALSGFVCLYYFNIMWLDVIYLAPLVLIGLDKVINKGKSYVYVVFLCLSIISNCYMGYILCMFLVIYFLYEISIKGIENKKVIILNFIKYSVLTAFLSAFILVPFAYELMHIYRNEVTFNDSLPLVFSRFAHIYYSFFITAPEHIITWWYPKLYFSIINFILLILYFLNKSIEKREKKISIFFLLFFVLCYSINLLNNIWHGSTPQILNYRYSFLITLFLINISCKSYLNVRNINVKSLMITIVIVLISYFTFFAIVDANVTFIILINLFFIISYGVLLNFNIKYKSYLYKLSLLIITILELLINLKLNFVTNKNFIKSRVNYDSNETLCEVLNTYDSLRIGGKVYSENEGLICNKGKIADFNTMNNKRAYVFLLNNGYSLGSSYVNNYYDEINIINDILGIKYFYTSENIENYYLKLQDIISKKGTYGLYKNNNSLSVGFAIDEHNKLKNTNNNFENQNNFINYLTGEKVYYKYDFTKIDNNTFEIYINNNYPIYINYQDIYFDSIYINGEEIKLNTDYEANTIPITEYTRTGNIFLENKYENQKIQLRIEVEGGIDENNLFIYYLDMAQYEKVIEKLLSEQLENIIIDKTELKGDIKLSENKTLFLSIPYDDNFTVYVDNKKAEYKELYNTFIGIDLEQGEHTIKLVYYPKYIYIGFSFSITTLIFLLLKKKK